MGKKARIAFCVSEHRFKERLKRKIFTTPAAEWLRVIALGT